jgi:hypothetical protein
MVSDWIVANLKGVFGESRKMRIKVTGWNMINPLRLVIYLVPLLATLFGALVFLLFIRYLYGAYAEVGENSGTINPFKALL